MIVEGGVLALDRANVDTDQIIPARYLTGVGTTGVGAHLFEGLDDGARILASRPGACIVVARENFGCGSSREHAVWALRERGFRAVVAPSFARIFQENAYAGGVVPVTVTNDEIDALVNARTMRIDVAAERYTAEGGEPRSFALDPLRKRFLLEGGFMDFISGKIPAVRAWLQTRPA